MNYVTTYGAEFFGCYDSSFVFIPAEDLEIPETIRGMRLVVIRPYNPEQIRQKAIAIAMQNTGLSDKTMSDLMIIFNNYLPDIATETIMSFPNREFQVRLLDAMGVMPEKADEFLRHIVFKATGKTLLIKNRKAINALHGWARKKEAGGKA